MGFVESNCFEVPLTFGSNSARLVLIMAPPDERLSDLSVGKARKRLRFNGRCVAAKTCNRKQFITLAKSRSGGVPGRSHAVGYAFRVSP